MNKENRLALEPSPLEMNILRVLWKVGPATLKNIHEHLQSNDSQANMGATFKLLHMMENRKFIKREMHQYSAVIDEQATRHRLLQTFVDVHFDGSAENLMQYLAQMHAKN